MATTPQTTLDELNVAITAILVGGQEYEVRGRRYKRADIDVLLRWRTRLEKEVSRNTGSMFTLAKLGNPR